VRDLILGFVPDEWLHSLDYRTLEIVPGSYVTEDLSKRSDDIVWRVQVGGEWVYLYLLIEFQSGVDQYMALRMMVYVGLLYQDLIKRGLLADGRLPPGPADRSLQRQPALVSGHRRLRPDSRRCRAG
jgi:hypothetical protein